MRTTRYHCNEENRTGPTVVESFFCHQCTPKEAHSHHPTPYMSKTAHQARRFNWSRFYQGHVSTPPLHRVYHLVLEKPSSFPQSPTTLEVRGSLDWPSSNSSQWSKMTYTHWRGFCFFLPCISQFVELR